MFIYYIFAIIVMFLLLMSYYLFKNNKLNVVDILVLFIVITFAGIRYYTGTDYGNYYKLFNYSYLDFSNLSIFNLISPDEIGLILVCRFFKYFFPNNQFIMFWVTSGLICVPLYIFIKRRSKKFVISFLCFILLGHYTMSFNIIKQYIAATFVFIAFNKFFENKKKSAFFYILLGTTFHYSSILYIPLLFIAKKIKANVSVFLLSIFSGFFINNVVSFILINFSFSTYKIYMNARGSRIGMALMSIIWILFGILLLIKKDSLLQLNSINNLYLNMFFISLIFNIGAISNIYLARLTIPLQYSLFFLIPDYIESIRTKFKKILYLLVVILLYIWYGFYISNYGGVIPYNTYLNII